MTIGVNWHNTISGTAVPLDNLLSLSAEQAGNIGWLGAASTNGGTIAVGFNANVTVPMAGVASATDGWPLSAGNALPILTGEGESLGRGLYGIASSPDQDLFVIGYAPDQGASASTVTTTLLALEDGVTLLGFEDGVTILGLEA